MVRTETIRVEVMMIEAITIKVVLVDDQPAIREGLKMRLALEPNLQVVGEAGNGELAVKIIQKLNPDVVVMDVEMPLMDGLTAVRRLLEVAPHIPVIMLSIHDDAITREKARAAGAVAFIGKQEAVEHLLTAIVQAVQAKSRTRTV